MPRAVREAKILLAPMELYRQILRVHRCLPPAMRSLGDDYVKAEFRRHKDVDNPVHLIGFVSQWQDFNVPKDGWGKKMDSELYEKMSDEQIGQLYELRNELKPGSGEKA
ncbi:hypothetical protein PHYBLDRAFT_112566 [Phycomyces blakesleeanus NRRL 1555(-)]|uniref:Succinate dehydrogenase assembly factor 3 n=1 Tax=Phycomyces blakesleeanus (strain ATCC 8743b / DSM 1359 / FGSC 10004 / NBRC 33097 / NRRL 1555) TaxID=763407 RepID=A0A162PTL9_PHYB8|nr:hypothetical protein PHYBLDRAFT_112566 [Phycomyces blakesleeanus NRRL 1555(-)]OAD73816.1 hypothetical protein PHYBLDRAFT_112566 [Phycomyces blakesleeanus NRRL 1555(-)]|eukprot:XP_018291856.1 hypothetical protein PHYBLDRAFT_112566 [Phycomyces blakesleeanus NRRL 1555(-)]